MQDFVGGGREKGDREGEEVVGDGREAGEEGEVRGMGLCRRVRTDSGLIFTNILLRQDKTGTHHQPS